MKKFFAALLAISITAALAGCDKPADEQLIDDITEGTSVVTEAAETVSETETETSAETASETAETTVETSTTTETSETSSETEKATTATSSESISETESNDEPRLAQHEELIGCWRNLEYQTTLIFDENRYIGLDKGWGEIVNDTVKDGMFKFSDGMDSDLTATICGDKLFIEEKEDDDETYLYEFERYTQPAVSLRYFDGDWFWDCSFDESEGRLLDFENGKGKFVPYGEKTSEADTDAEINVNEDKVTLTIGDDTGDYKYYTLENTVTDVRFVFLIDDKKIIKLTQWL